MSIMVLLALSLLQTPAVPAVDNDYVRVNRGHATCEQPSAACVDRVLVALGVTTVVDPKGMTRSLQRGDIVVAGEGEAYAVQGGDFAEVIFKPGHPAVLGPRETIAPEKNSTVFDGPRFFVFEEKLAPGDTRPRHSHAQRVVITLNRTTLEQEQFYEPETHLVKPQVPARIGFNQPVVHIVKNSGDQPLRNIVVEMKP
jgi:hypothetical protein